jgi:hypothetical protein
MVKLASSTQDVYLNILVHCRKELLDSSFYVSTCLVNLVCRSDRLKFSKRILQVTLHSQILHVEI